MKASAYPRQCARIVLLAVAACAPGEALGGAGTCLDSGTTYATTGAADDDAPFAVAACDLDGDGHPDLATVNDASDTVSVLLNDGAGGFGTLRRWRVGPTDTQSEPVDLACCDFDGDERLDLLTVNRLADNVSILLNLGILEDVPQFSTATHYSVGEAPWAIGCARIDADAYPDIVTVNITSNNVSVLINDGAGGVDQIASHTVAVGDGPRAMTLCDIDADTDLDVMTANVTGKSVTVLRNDGAAGLVDTGDTDLDVSAFGLACCDLDGMNGPDLVTANLIDDSVTALFNDGNGGFGGLTRTSGGDGAAAVTCADTDHDGDLDVATANLTSDDIILFSNRGTGALDPPVVLTAVLNPSAVIAGPLATAGPDLVATHADGVTLLRNTCAGVCTTDADCADDGRFCNGMEFCDAGSCSSVGSPCVDSGTTCWEDTDTCEPAGDLDRDSDCDLADFTMFQACFDAVSSQECRPADLDGSGSVELNDYADLHRHFSGPDGTN